MKKTLVVLAHPDVEKKSIANKIIVERIKALASLKINDLYIAAG